MRYLLNIYVDESRWENPAPDERQAAMEAYRAFDREVREAGAFVAGEGLTPSATATVVRVRAGERTLTDGPFAETREALGGFYLLECKDLDEAIEWAAKIPGAHTGAVEIRPAIDFEEREAETGAAQEPARA
jgi:hypothetical protein